MCLEYGAGVQCAHVLGRAFPVWAKANNVPDDDIKFQMVCSEFYRRTVLGVTVLLLRCVTIVATMVGSWLPDTRNRRVKILAICTMI